MIVEFLYFEGCPHAGRALDLLREVLVEEGIAEEIVMIEVDSTEQAKEIGFLGSPSIRIDGSDVEKGRENDPPLLGCRIYSTDEGMRGYPSREMIVTAIRRVPGN